MEQAKTPSELRASVVNYLDYLRDNPVTSDGVHLKESYLPGLGQLVATNV